MLNISYISSRFKRIRFLPKEKWLKYGVDVVMSVRNVVKFFYIVSF